MKRISIMDRDDSIELSAERLLKTTNEILARRNEFLEASGNGYNLFSSLDLTYEKFHSRMIASVLSPDARHGLGTLFLRRFLETLKLDAMAIAMPSDPAKIAVETEKDIGPLSADNEEGGRIDIVITTGNFIVLIENKVDERTENNQPLQLYRYKKWLDKQQPIHKLLVFLTPTGKTAHTSSTDGNDFKLCAENKDYLCVSYASIGKWIESCIKDSALFPRIRETLVQYRDYLGTQFSIPAFGDKYMKEVEQLIKKGSFAAAEAIANALPDAKAHVMESLLKNVLLSKIDSIADVDTDLSGELKRFVDGTATANNPCKLFVRKHRKTNEDMGLALAWDSDTRRPGIGIFCPDGGALGEQLLARFANQENKDATKHWPYWIWLDHFSRNASFYDSDDERNKFRNELEKASNILVNAFQEASG